MTKVEQINDVKVTLLMLNNTGCPRQTALEETGVDLISQRLEADLTCNLTR